MYLAILWDFEDLRQTESAARLAARVQTCFRGWRIAANGRGLFVCIESSPVDTVHQTYQLKLECGAIFGQLFERGYVESEDTAHHVPAPVHFDDSISTRVALDRGTTLRDRFWGQYVAFLRDTRSGRRYVLRDPSGAIPCNHALIDGVSVYFARLQDFETITPPRGLVNRHFIVGRLVLGTRSSGETGVDGVSNVLPGERVQHAGQDRTSDFFWDPIQIAATRASTDLSRASKETRRIVQACVHAWTSRFESLALQLSGGFDSTVVAACLASAPNRPNLLCVNCFHDRGTSDERNFAREVANHFGFELIELHTPDLRTIDLEANPGRALVPPSLVTAPATADYTDALSASRSITGSFRGDGGDELFYRDGELPDAVDEAYQNGLTARLWQVAVNDAAIDRKSVWETLQIAYRHGVLRREYDWRSLKRILRRSLFTEEARVQAVRDETHWHPLFRGRSTCPPGKMMQAYRLLKYCTGNAHVRRSADDTPTVLSPLVSQPHMELALSTPLAVLRAGRRDRAVARAAFADIIPTKILTRWHKSLSVTPTQHWLSGAPAKAREFLLDGYLARERIVDRRAVESAFKDVANIRLYAPDLISCLFVEVWTRRMTGTPPALDRVNTHKETADGILR